MNTTYLHLDKLIILSSISDNCQTDNSPMVDEEEECDKVEDVEIFCLINQNLLYYAESKHFS